MSAGDCARVMGKHEETGLDLDSQDFHLYRDSALRAIARSHMRRINALPG
jgi:hypothetical protein